jgi:hypothetical protein
MRLVVVTVAPERRSVDEAIAKRAGCDVLLVH